MSPRRISSPRCAPSRAGRRGCIRWRSAALVEQLRNRQADPLALLTQRERSVLDLIARGMSNRQIGDELHLTEGTVKGYVSTILAKLKLEDRTQAALFAVQRGIGKAQRARSPLDRVLRTTSPTGRGEDNEDQLRLRVPLSPLAGEG